MKMTAFICTLILTVSAAGPLSAARERESGTVTKAADPARVVKITGGDDMKFNVTRITAKRGEQIRLKLTSTGKMPKIVMAHNVVFLQLGTDVDKFVSAGAPHRDTDFIAPAMKNRVLAKTALAGPGETVELLFTAPAKPGSYAFICTFPGHYQSGMKGLLVVQ